MNGYTLYIYAGIIYFILVNLVSIILTIYDKKIAGSGKIRISENTFMWFAFFGGAFSMYLAMKKFRHKTQHRKFMMGIPIIIAVHLILLVGGVLYFLFQ